jgi:hypothetical protein
LKTKSNSRRNYASIAVGIIIILIIGFKVIAPVLLHTQAITKTFITSNPDDNDDEKKSETHNRLDKDFTAICNDHINFVTSYTQISHYTAYYNNYLSSHFSTITIPPPDSMLSI